MHTKGNIWMAYRAVRPYSDFSGFAIYCITPSIEGGYGCGFNEDTSSEFDCRGLPAGVRPVVTLDAGLKVVGGDGTKEKPYILAKATNYIEPYIISYNANGGIEAPVRQKKLPNVSLKLSSVEPVRAGYKFLGWSESSSATSPDYLSGNTFTANKNATLYAVWQLQSTSLVPMNTIPVGAYIQYTPEARTVTALGSDETSFVSFKRKFERMILEKYSSALKVYGDN